MRDGTGIIASGVGLVLAGWLASAAPVLAQGSGGLVISSLPSDVVIGSAPAGAAPPLQLLESGTGPMDPTLATAPGPQRDGLPRPSIIVGDMAILAALGPQGPLGMPFALREAIRARDAALFERLLGQGVFDPEPERLAEAIQTELQRSQCYSGGVDGKWGAGSARAVERWQQAADGKVSAAGLGSDPAPQLFRAIARGGDLRCAAVAPPVATAATTKPKPSRDPVKPAKPSVVAAKPVQPARPAQPVQAAKPASTAPQINPSMIGSGMFR